MTKKLILIVGLYFMAMSLSFGQTTDSAVIITNGKNISQGNTIDSATVYVSFIVETTGKITNVKVDKIKCRKCKKEFKESLKLEAVKVISSIPDNEPRKERIKFIQPLKFMIEDK